MKEPSNGQQERAKLEKKWRFGANSVSKGLNEKSVEVNESKLDRRLN